MKLLLALLKVFYLSLSVEMSHRHNYTLNSLLVKTTPFGYYGPADSTGFVISKARSLSLPGAHDTHHSKLIFHGSYDGDCTFNIITGDVPTLHPTSYAKYGSSGSSYRSLDLHPYIDLWTWNNNLGLTALIFPARNSNYLLHCPLLQSTSIKYYCWSLFCWPKLFNVFKGSAQYKHLTTAGVY